MFQTFEDVSDPKAGTQRVKLLRELLKTQKLDGFIVPQTDEFQNEYLPEHARRLLWLTGFSGSAGSAVILHNKAAMFIDGRYTLQVRDQVDIDIFETLQVPQNPMSGWLSDNLPKGSRLGYDSNLITLAGFEKLRLAVEAAGSRLISVRKNLVDMIWEEQPAPPKAPIILHKKKYSGLEASEKIKALQEKLLKAEQDGVMITQPPSLCWLFNIRGGDVPCAPLVLGYAFVPAVGKPKLFLDADKLNEKQHTALSELADILEPAKLSGQLKAFVQDVGKGAKIRLHAATTSVRIANMVKAASGSVCEADDPISLPKAVKNKAETKGSRQAHIQDGAAVTRFLAWLERQEPGSIDEISAVKKLEKFRRKTGILQDISFETISGAGDHGAIVHYRVSESSNRLLEEGTLFLVDSGGQYFTGTTDITRTVAIGTPSEEMKRSFTLVLKGHINLAMARFPEGTRGVDLDVLARAALWNAGLDYDHGTGHGVGSYLSVHEGPQNISKRGMTPLQPGMIVSNEPGYYKTGQYGIRIENLVLVMSASKIQGGERKMLGFETLTKVPISKNLIVTELLNADELSWLNAYHQQVWEDISPLVEKKALAWLKKATKKIG